MKLTASARYLSLLLDTFQSRIIPDLHSPEVIGNVGYLSDALREVLRRELHYADALPTINAEGRTIAAEMRQALGIGAPPPGEQDDPFAMYERLNADIAQLAERLSRESASPQSLLRRAATWECEAHAKLLGLDADKKGATADCEPLPRAAFESFIRSEHPDRAKVEVTQYERVPGGFGSQTWAVAVKDADAHEHRWIVRKKDRVAILKHKTSGLEREYHLVSAVNRTGYPAPKPLWFAADAPGADAPFYVMERMPGKPAGSFLGGTEKLPKERLLEVAELLARLHSIPLDSLRDFIERFDSTDVLAESVEQVFRRNLAAWRAYTKETEHLPSPTLVYLFDWLERNVPKDNGRPVLSHGDFGIHNMLVENGRISAVLDWEAASFNSPALDLAYIRPVIEQHMDWPKFLGHYERHANRSIDPDMLRYCSAYQAMCILVPVNRAVKLLQDGDLAEIRHTVFELGLAPHFLNMALASTASS